MENKIDIDNLEQVYKKVFGDLWEGKDPGALRERLDELLYTEKNYLELTRKIKDFSDLFFGSRDL